MNPCEVAVKLFTEGLIALQIVGLLTKEQAREINRLVADTAMQNIAIAKQQQQHEQMPSTQVQ